MDVDLLKSAPEDQIDMLMMMQMDKLPDFCGAPYNDAMSDEMSPMDFTQANGININTNRIYGMSQFTENPPSFVNLPPSISFISSPPIQEPIEHPFLSNSNVGRWRNGGEFPSQAQKRNSMAAMREMIFRIAAMQPIHIDPESVKPPKRRNVKISKDPQSVAARHRRERISERIRILQRLVPGGTKMDTASMLDEAIHYVKFLKNQVQTLGKVVVNRPMAGVGFLEPMSSGSFVPLQQGTKGYYQPSAIAAQNVQHFLDA